MTTTAITIEVTGRSRGNRRGTTMRGKMGDNNGTTSQGRTTGTTGKNTDRDKDEYRTTSIMRTGGQQ